MRVKLVSSLAAVAIVLVPSLLRAQTHSSVVFQAAIGSHSTSGGSVDFRTGFLLDVLAAFPIRETATRSVVIAAGGSTVFGGSGDRCLFTPSGGCAPKANFGVANVLIGVEQAVDSLSARALIGPALYDGAGARSVGVQGRLDLMAPVASHLAVGVMGRATLLPSHGRQSLTAWAGGFSIGFR